MAVISSVRNRRIINNKNPQFKTNGISFLFLLFLLIFEELNRKKLGEELKAEEGNDQSYEYSNKGAESMKLPKVVTSRPEAESSAQIGRSQKKKESQRSEIAVTRLINGFSQREPHSCKTENIPPDK